ncbi:hypothetical protein RUND412_010384 [Rhizina undulata]
MNNTSSASFGSSNLNTTTLRPRNRGVGSGSVEGGRPLPARHPSRNRSPGRNNDSGSGDRGYWGAQWSSLQSLASSVLGSEEPTPPLSQQVRRRRNEQNTNGSSGGWFSDLLAGGGEPTEAGRGEFRPRGRRRDEDFAPTGGGEGGSLGDARRYKRASSPSSGFWDTPSQKDRERERESDTFVYVHQVKNTDTLEGVVIMYNIHSSALRRANGMWPGDSLQSRRELLLPVDDCAVKGKPIPDDKDINTNGLVAPGGVDGAFEEDQEKPYRHSSYVHIDGIGKVQIARLARKNLSHFPPRRRKSTVNAPKSTTSLSILDDPIPSDFMQMPFSHAGVAPLHPEPEGSNPFAGIGGEALVTTIGDLARDTGAGLQNVGGVIEGFVRKWAVKAKDFTGTDLIELTQRLGIDVDGGRSVAGRDERGNGVGREGISSAAETDGAARQRMGRGR